MNYKDPARYELKPCHTFNLLSKHYTIHGGYCNDCRARFDGVKRTDEFARLMKQFKELTLLGNV